MDLRKHLVVIFDTMTLLVPDAPRPDEIVIALAIADGGRPRPRSGKGRVG